MNTINRRRTQLSVVAVAALAIFAVAAVVLLSGGFATGPAQAQSNTNLNTGKYKDPQPCGINASKVPNNPDGEFSGGHVALFDAYWDYNTKTLNNNLCPPLAEHEVQPPNRQGIRKIVTGRAKSNIDINETVFHAGDEFSYTITAADKSKYDFLPPAGTKVWWLKQDDPEAEAEEAEERKKQGLPPAAEEPELVLGISAGLFNEHDWHLDGGVPLQYEFESERDPEGNVIPFLVFKNDAPAPIWDSRKVDSAAIPIKPGEYDHYNWMFFPEAGQRHTYVLEVHLKGHVRTEPGPGAPDGWQPLTWPTGEGATAYTPKKRTDAFEETLDSIETVVSSEVRKEKYTIHVGPLHLNEQPEFGAMGVVTAGAAAGTRVGQPIPIYGVDSDPLHLALGGVGSENFDVTQTQGTHVGVKAQLVVAANANLSYGGDDPNDLGPAYYDLSLSVSDRHDHENGTDTAIDDTIPVRIFVLPSGKPSVALSFKNEHPRSGATQYPFARVQGLPAGATMTHMYLNNLDASGKKHLLAIHNGSQLTERFRNIKPYHSDTQNLFVEAIYQLNGVEKKFYSGLYPITWLR